MLSGTNYKGVSATYPFHFTAVPVVTASGWVDGMASAKMGYVKSQLNAVDAYVLSNGNVTSDISCGASYHVSGRWK